MNNSTIAKDGVYQVEQGKTGRAQWPEEVYKIEIPPEVQQKMMQEGENHQILDSEVADLQFIDISKRPYRFVKRGFDIVLSALGLLVLFLPIAIVCLLIYIDDPGKVLFRQYRVGLHGKRFRMYKLRCMETVRRRLEIFGYIRAFFCTIQTTDFRNAHFRHQIDGVLVVEVG